MGIGLCGGTGGCCTFPVGGRSVEIKAFKWKEKFCIQVSGATGLVHHPMRGQDVPTPGPYTVGHPWPLAFSVPAQFILLLYLEATLPSPLGTEYLSEVLLMKAFKQQKKPLDNELSQYHEGVFSDTAVKWTDTPLRMQASVGAHVCIHVYVACRATRTGTPGCRPRVKSTVAAREAPALGPALSLTRALRGPPPPLPPSLKGGVSQQLRLPNHRLCTETHISLIITEASPGQAGRVTVFRLFDGERPGQDCE